VFKIHRNLTKTKERDKHSGTYAGNGQVLPKVSRAYSSRWALGVTANNLVSEMKAEMAQYIEIIYGSSSSMIRSVASKSASRGKSFLSTIRFAANLRFREIGTATAQWSAFR
jgi:hypothetical protein